MVAFGLSIGLFLVYSAVGLAVLVLLHVRRHPVQQLLLAPGVGLCVCSLTLFTLNRWGLPVQSFGPTLLTILLVLTAGLFVAIRPRFPWSAYSPFAGLILLGLLVTGSPILQYGFDWVSYCNDDMANYCLGAQRFLLYPYDAPQSAAMAEGREYCQYFWYMHVAGGARSASELLLAWVSSFTGLTPLQGVMPLILSFHGALLSVTAGLALKTRRGQRVALAACLLLGFSALTALGSLYQLLAQIPGLAVLIVAIVLLVAPTVRMNWQRMICHGLLISVVLSGLMLVYPEVLPFLIGGVGFHCMLCWWYRKFQPGRYAFTLATAGVGASVILNSYGSVLLRYLGQQAAGGTSKTIEAAQQFPYFLLPSGPANLWGLIPLDRVPDEPWLSLGIVGGGVLTVVALLCLVWMVPRRYVAASVLVAMCGAGVLLFWNRQGFGLFKLAMFLQPFLCCVLAAAVVRMAGRRTVPLGVLVTIPILASLPALTSYVTSSRGTGAALNELADASGSRMMAEFNDILQKKQPTSIVQATDNPILIKLVALHARGIPIAFPSEDFFSYLKTYDPQAPRPDNIPLEWTQSPYVRFDMHDDRMPGQINPIRVCYPQSPPPGGFEDALFLAPSQRVTILNHRRSELTDGRMFRYAPRTRVRNYLMPVSSLLGQPYYVARDLPHTAQWQIEPDPCVPATNFAALGRYFAFEVVNPSDKVRLVLDMTVSHHGFGDIELPQGSVIGAERRELAQVGSGSARVVSPPIEPQWINGRAYVMLDLGADPKLLKFWRRKGLMALYGSELRTDRRWVVGWSRDISALSEEEYHRWSPPAKISSLPGDLTHPDLEYSGVCEDGWVAAESYFCLAQNSAHKSVKVRGMLVQLPGQPPLDPEMTVLVDGVPVGKVVVPTGEFELRFATPPGTGRRKVELRFSKIQTLPKPDARRVAVCVRELGFDESPPR